MTNKTHKKRVKLSVVLATRNEEKNLVSCLKSFREIADEIVVVDEGSTDRTREIAKSYGAKIFKVKHEPIFHITKQKAIDKATGDWILQLDADEQVLPELAEEIRKELRIKNYELRKEGLKKKKLQNPKKWKLFKRHEESIRRREGRLGKQTGEFVAYFVPRLNYFLGKPLKHAGVYPDGAIRLIKAGKARLPGKSVHELMEADGEVGWLFNDLEHHESPTLERYLDRANRYTDLTAERFKKETVSTNPLFLIHYSFFKPLWVFLNLYIRHKGFLDGMRGFIWSVFSALHFPLAYFKYWQTEK